MAALSRSAELTKGVRLKILGLFLVLGVCFWLLSIVLGFVGLKMYGPATAAYGFGIGNLLGSAILGTISNVLWGTIQPSLYVELRQAKEGTSAERQVDIYRRTGDLRAVVRSIVDETRDSVEQSARTYHV